MRDIISVIDSSVSNRTRSKFYGSEYTGACPWCGGSNRFHVWPDCNDIPGIGPLGRFQCMGSKQGRAGCDRSGDMLSYLEQHDGLTFAQACQRLDIDPQLIINYRRANKGLAPTTYKPRERAIAETSDSWKMTAHALSRNASACLTGEPLDYLLSRGLIEATIKRARLGYYPRYKLVKGDKWGMPGKQLLLPHGIVIPWFDALGNVVCIRFRRLPSDESEDAKKYYGVNETTGEINRYRAIRGVSSAYLYGSDQVVSGEPAALFEGEIDALIAGQAEVCNCVATGSTGWAHSEEGL
jgi:DNA primase